MKYGAKAGLSVPTVSTPSLNVSRSAFSHDGPAGVDCAAGCSYSSSPQATTASERARTIAISRRTRGD
jgi:hypothetical protein